MMSLKKSITLITISCFLFTSVLSQGLYAMADTEREKQKARAILDGFILPSFIGRVSDARYFGSRKVVINIQDLHCHSEVQRNIAKILSLLDEKYTLPAVYVEGGIGRIDTSWTQMIENASSRQRMVDALLESGRLTGAEYYSIRSGKTGLLAGLEDEKLYTDNLLRLNSILEKHEQIQTTLPEIKISLEGLADRYYQSDNRRFDRVLNKYAKGELSAEKFYRILLRYAEKAGVDPQDYANLQEFLRLVELQKRLRYRKISRELASLVADLKQRLPYTAYSALMKKTGDLSRPDELYAYLAKITAEYHITIGDEYPELAKFFALIEANGKINPLSLVREEKRLIRELHSRLSRSRSEREVAFIADFFGCLQEYLGNKITAEDLEYFREQVAGFKVLWEKYLLSDKIPSLAAYYELFDRFYEVNKERNTCFIRNILEDKGTGERKDIRQIPSVDHVQKVMESLAGTKEVIVTVTGGFHTTGLTELLKDRQVSYMVITPAVTSDTVYSERIYNELARHHAQIIASQTMALPLLSQELARLNPDEAKCELYKGMIEGGIESGLEAGKSPEQITKIISTILGDQGLFQYERRADGVFFVFNDKTSGQVLYFRVQDRKVHFESLQSNPLPSEEKISGEQAKARWVQQAERVAGETAGLGRRSLVAILQFIQKVSDTIVERIVRIRATRGHSAVKQIRKLISEGAFQKSQQTQEKLVDLASQVKKEGGLSLIENLPPSTLTRPLPLHVKMSDDLKQITYSRVLDDSGIRRADGTIDYSRLKLLLREANRRQHR
jgi:hypothetical protein